MKLSDCSVDLLLFEGKATAAVTGDLAQARSLSATAALGGNIHYGLSRLSAPVNAFQIRSSVLYYMDLVRYINKQCACLLQLYFK
jgi:hypothetical protein